MLEQISATSLNGAAQNHSDFRPPHLQSKTTKKSEYLTHSGTAEFSKQVLLSDKNIKPRGEDTSPTSLLQGIWTRIL